LGERGNEAESVLRQCFCVQAAVTVAHRVAQEMGSEIGRQVGYAIRFEERTSQDTRIVYLTGASPPPAPPCLEDTASWTDPVVGCQNAWPTEKTRQVKGREVSSVGNRREGRGGGGCGCSFII